MNIEHRITKYGILPVESLPSRTPGSNDRVERSIIAKKTERSDTILRNSAIRCSAVLRFAVQRCGFWSYLLWLVLMTVAMASTAQGENRALLIGVGRYAHFDDRLNGVSLDLDMMTEMAQLMGYQKKAIKILENEHATTTNVYQTFDNWLINEIEPEDRVLIYFSGHGSQVLDESDDEKDQFDEVLLLYDTILSVKNGRPSLEGVLHDDRFHRMLTQIKSRNILVILDACHSGSATRGLRPIPRTIPVNDAQVKYFYYSPMLKTAGASGRFDVMEPSASSDFDGRYVAMTACRDDEKTVATSQGSIFTLGLRQALRAAAMAGISITPEELKHQTTRYIQEQFQSDVVAFHPQIAGHKKLRQRPLELAVLSGGNGMMRQNLAALAEKSHETIRLNLNKTCYEPGDVLEISVKITGPGYLNVMSIAADDQATVLFPNQYHPQNAVGPGKLTIPTAQMDFELVSDGPPGPRLITAFLTRAPLNNYKDGFKTKNDAMADLSPRSTRSLILRQKKDWLAAGKASVEIRQEGRCE
ncbi:hypothetical protein D1BOALGB6SA_2245 [Olavius sp. associated proteobacterium Delta 1]|nr:hypothetical protein D1BOALGB6SA_2245 [Olavius sp. associated proteobacterium Delta 1]